MADRVDRIRRRALSATSNAAAFTPIAPKAPPPTSAEYDPYLASLASRILYRSGLDPSGSGGPLFILCAAAFPDTKYVDYNKLLPYVLSILPADEELLEDKGYSVIFFAGGSGDRGTGDYTYGAPAETAAGGKINRPAWSWSLQAYNLLGRAVRKKIKKLWIVHERAWVRIIFEMAQTVVSPKFKKKVVHVGTLSELATLVRLQDVDIPPAVYLHDRKIEPAIATPDFLPPVFGVRPFPSNTEDPKLPTVLTDTSRYLRSHHLQVEGLFRISPHLVLLEVVREAYDRGQKLRMSDYGPHIAAGLIKLYYRSLPEPLIPKAYYKELEAKLKSPEDVKPFLLNSESEGGLPFTSRILLTRHLLPLLVVVVQHSAANKMPAANLATCISPNLVHSEDPMADVMISRGAVSNLVKWGIELIDELVPALPTSGKPRKPVPGEVVVPPKSVNVSFPKRSPALRRTRPKSRNGDGPKSPLSEEFSPPLPPRVKVTPDIPMPTASLLDTPVPKLEPIVPQKPAALQTNPSSSTLRPTLPVYPNKPTPTNTTTEKILRRSVSFPASPRPPPPTNNKIPLPSPSPIATSTSPTIAASIRKFQAQLNSTSSSSSSPPASTTPPPPPPIKRITKARSDINLGRSAGIIGRELSVVEELRRLYEERAKTTEVLVKAVPPRRGSGVLERKGSKVFERGSGVVTGAGTTGGVGMGN